MPDITRTAAEVAAMLEDGREIAFLDVREIVPFGTGHPLLATHLALGYIECEIARLVPRRDTRVIVTDGGEGLSAVAAHRLARFGYTNVAVQIDPERDQIADPRMARRYLEDYFGTTGARIHVYWGSVARFVRELRDNWQKRQSGK